MAEGEIYPRFILGKSDFGSFALTAPERINLKTFDRMHAVFALAGSALIRSGKVGDKMSSKVEEKEMTCRFLARFAFAVDPPFIVDGGSMVVAMSRVNRESVEFGNSRERINR